MYWSPLIYPLSGPLITERTGTMTLNRLCLADSWEQYLVFGHHFPGAQPSQSPEVYQRRQKNHEQNLCTGAKMHTSTITWVAQYFPVFWGPSSQRICLVCYMVPPLCT